MAAIEVDGLTKVYGETVANDDLTFSVREGEIFGFLGPNGAGKSTLIRMLLGFQSPTAGSATVLGRDVRDEQALLEAKADVGYLPATPGFDEGVTGRTFLDYQAELKGDERRAELLDLFDPPLDRKIRAYSTGNRQMLAIIQTFMHDPDLVIMDEPTSGLDPLKQEHFNDFLRRERDRGLTVFFSSHILGEVRRVCDRVGIIREGHLAALEDVEDLLARGGKRVRVTTADPVDAADFEFPGVRDAEFVGRQAQFTFTGDYDDLVAHLTGYDLVDLEIEEPPLEDVFMHFYGDAPVDTASERNGDTATGSGDDPDAGRDAAVTGVEADDV